MVPESRSQANELSRRRFLASAAAGAAGLAAPRAARALGARAPQPYFQAIPAERSGIHWTHTAGLSPQMYLPETVGAGCAFLDFDNDGWMDIYLVNSGPCDFYEPTKPLRNALYKNNRDGSFTDVTEKAGVPGSA
ncbi:MAG TPA: VCBS repeat-containing protein, partial [Chthonomonadales bacterium]|nr:VCBS repeat-containing protein [Chthonomonadales bacterium]